MLRGDDALGEDAIEMAKGSQVCQWVARGLQLYKEQPCSNGRCFEHSQCSETFLSVIND